MLDGQVVGGGGGHAAIIPYPTEANSFYCVQVILQWVDLGFPEAGPVPVKAGSKRINASLVRVLDRNAGNLLTCCRGKMLRNILSGP